MPNRLHFIVLIKGLWVLVALTLGVFALIAYLEHDGHWLNRGGAVVAALAAGSILVQIAIEISLEHSRHALQAGEPNASARAITDLLPLDRLVLRVRLQRVEADVQRLERERLSVALRVVLCAMLGELVHGFGDLIACSTFVTCSCHAC